MTALNYNVPAPFGWSVCVACRAEARIFSKGWSDEFSDGVVFGDEARPALCECEGSPWGSVCCGTLEAARVSAQRHRDGYWQRERA